MASSVRNYDTKATVRSRSGEYMNFGWIPSKDRVPDGTKVKSKKEPVILMKRKYEFATNGRLVSLENDYEKLSKKKYRNKPLLGIIFFLLMFALLVVTGVVLYFGISAGLEGMKFPGTYYYYNNAGEKDENTSIVLEKDAWTYGSEQGSLEKKKDTISLYVNIGTEEEPENELRYTGSVKDGAFTFTNEKGTKKTQRYFSDASKEENKISKVVESTEEEEATEEEAEGGILETIKGVLNTVHDDYLSKVTGIFDGKTNEETGEYTDGISDTLGGMLGQPMASFITGDTLVGLIALILAIIFLILFAEVCKMKKKREKRNAKIEVILDEAAGIVEQMKRSNPQLMPKANRKAYMWETIITNALRNANMNGGDEDDDY